MNRIRQHNGKHQVIITPHHRFDTGFELMLGNWTDSKLKNYSIKEFTNLEDAQCEALLYPDIDWLKIVLFHKEIYLKLHKIIKSELETNNFIVDFEAKIMTADELKNTMFNRVMQYGKRFNLSYNLNDIIGFHIINPWNSNLNEIKQILIKNKTLRISKIHEVKGSIKLIGVTDIGTTYEITLWPTLIAQWARWVSKEKNLSEKAIDDAFNDAVKAQEQINNTINLR